MPKKRHFDARQEAALQAINLIKNAVLEETQKVLPHINQDLAESNDKLGVILKEAKKNCNRHVTSDAEISKR